jgi:hypothetical protein
VLCCFIHRGTHGLLNFDLRIAPLIVEVEFKPKLKDKLAEISNFISCRALLALTESLLRPYGDLTESLLRPYGDLTESLLRPYGDLTETLRRPY